MGNCKDRICSFCVFVTCAIQTGEYLTSNVQIVLSPWFAAVFVLLNPRLTCADALILLLATNMLPWYGAALFMVKKKKCTLVRH